MKRALVFAALLTPSCYTPARQVVKQKAMGSIEPAERDKAFARALAVLQSRGWIVAVSDRAGGLLATQTMQTGVTPCGALTCPSRETLQITIADTGAVTVNLHRELFLAFANNYWFTPRAEQDVAAIEVEQEEILAAITGDESKVEPARQRLATIRQQQAAR